jgi:hypothetical protein
MSHGHEQAIEVLDRELDAVSSVLNDLTDADWERPTHLIPEGEGIQPWRIADLVAHIDISIGLTLGLLDTIQTGQPGRDRASFFIADRSTVAPVVTGHRAPGVGHVPGAGGRAPPAGCDEPPAGVALPGYLSSGARNEPVRTPSSAWPVMSTVAVTTTARQANRTVFHRSPTGVTGVPLPSSLGGSDLMRRMPARSFLRMHNLLNS